MRTEPQGHGYTFVIIEGHPMADSRGRILMHRYVMSEHLGRILSDDEVVHHINGDRNDNRVENLQLLTPGEHTRTHNPPKWVELRCPECEREFRRTQRQIKGKLCFCSRRCSSAYYGRVNPRGVGCPRPITHSLTGYGRGCRCTICKEAHRLHLIRWRQKKREEKANEQRA